MKLTVYLSGEIHTDWRNEITRGIAEKDLQVTLTSITLRAMIVAMRF